MRAGIVGCGSIAQVHAACINQLPGLKLAAFADIRRERAGDMAARYGGKAYGSLEEMLSLGELDVVHICTPHYLHTPMAVQCLEAGKHVFMEKPPVVSKEQLEILTQAAQNTDRCLGLCFQNRYNPSILAVRKILESGEAGKVLGGRGLVTWKRNAGYYTESGWRGAWETEGGGALINQSVHTLDLLASFLGKPVSVEASMANHHLKGVIQVEDMMEAYIRFVADGCCCTGCFYATTAYCDDAPPLIEICCENMTIRVEELNVTLYYRDGRVERPEIPSRAALGKSYWGAGHLDCISSFYKAAEEGRAFELNPETLRETICLMLAVYESAKTGREVTLPV